ncbi:Flp pilus assembly complex ATPase component TadA [Candidatus Sumerlaeota bacterium]|nr:Flp pilus assembly complex ATPase component TadA [Candidatus Sumerlaeota bacterium]
MTMQILHPPESLDHAPVWLGEMIEWAHALGATDVHLFPSTDGGRLWVRLNGDLQEICSYSVDLHTRMVSRLKVLGRCTDYTGAPIQEGRFGLNGVSRGGEARLSIIPTLQGEKAVIRLLAGENRKLELDQLGFGEELRSALRSAMDLPQGLLLAVAPSGCGKSTALYALLADLHARQSRPVSIVTLEDPVEQSLPFAAQVNIEAERGLTFGAGLRAILRQDPEVILIGEIRDAETSRAALEAALTGHRILSSMHTLNAAEALARLMQMGSPPYIIASALAGILNVRLLRLCCEHCKTARTPEPLEAERMRRMLGQTPEKIAATKGCERCLDSGVGGRTGVGEWLTPTAAMPQALGEGRPTPEIQKTLRIVASAQQEIMRLLTDLQIAPMELAQLTGMSSLETPPSGECES